ncbi:hypothetical protein [Blastomonas sp.]|uniref:hypothetical protein n=1 Tax=Blastomonas sp. TaxID=1909299 RepID=UPI0025841115|nr:hypothetical protein [Blastomonas sp.]
MMLGGSEHRTLVACGGDRQAIRTVTAKLSVLLFLPYTGAPANPDFLRIDMVEHINRRYAGAPRQIDFCCCFVDGILRF